MCLLWRSDLASGADFTVRAGDWDFVASGAFGMAKQCMTVVDTDRLQSVAEALRCQRHDDGSDGKAWRVMIGPRNATLSRQHELSRWMCSSGTLCCSVQALLRRALSS